MKMEKEKKNFFWELAAIEDKIWPLLKLHGYDERGTRMSKILMGTIWSLLLMVRVQYIICKKVDTKNETDRDRPH